MTSQIKRLGVLVCLGKLLIHFIDRFVFCDFLIDQFLLVLVCALFLDDNFLDVLIKLKSLVELLELIRLKLVITEVNCFDFSKDFSELGDETDTILQVEVFHREIEATILLQCLHIHVMILESFLTVFVFFLI